MIFKHGTYVGTSGEFTVGPGGLDPPGSEFRLCIVFSSKFKNIKKYIHYEKFNGTSPPQDKFPRSATGRYHTYQLSYVILLS